MKTPLILFMVIFVSACTLQKKNNLRESLDTEIRADGSKVFSFSVVMHIDKNNQKTNGMRPGEHHQPRAGQNKSQARSSIRGNNTSSEELTEYFDRRLQNLPIISLFCRKNYFVLDRLNAKNEITLRAECHDSATSEDYKRFKSSALPANMLEEKSN